MICSMIKPDLSDSGRFEYIKQMWEALGSGKKMTYDRSVFLSENNTGDKNMAIAYNMMGKKAFPEKTDVERTLEFYVQCCAL